MTAHPITLWFHGWLLACALTLTALAGVAYGKHADFLRAYGIARLPADPAIRARAAKMLIEQKQPELARKVTGANPAK